jgi:DNA-binding response OmpR family regulator
MVQARESYPYKILIVDDEVEIRHLIATFLLQKGHICEHASDGMEALKKAAQESYDAVISDVVMPKMDGIMFLRELRKRDLYLPVMVMTGFCNRNYKGHPIDEEAIYAGATDFISKPFDLDEFWVRFQKMMLDRRTLSQIQLHQQEIEKISNEMINELQKESIERIEALKKECEELRKRLNHP